MALIASLTACLIQLSYCSDTFEVIDEELFKLESADDRVDRLGRSGDTYIIVDTERELSYEDAVLVAENIFKNDIITNSGLVYLNFYNNKKFLFQLFKMGNKWMKSGTEFY